MAKRRTGERTTKKSIKKFKSMSTLDIMNLSTKDMRSWAKYADNYINFKAKTIIEKGYMLVGDVVSYGTRDISLFTRTQLVNILSRQRAVLNSNSLSVKTSRVITELLNKEEYEYEMQFIEWVRLTDNSIYEALGGSPNEQIETVRDALIKIAYETGVYNPTFSDLYRYLKQIKGKADIISVPRVNYEWYEEYYEFRD